LQSFRQLNPVLRIPGVMPQVLNWQAFSLYHQLVYPNITVQKTYQNTALVMNEMLFENLNQPERLK
jgi:hypothetical protein